MCWGHHKLDGNRGVLQVSGIRAPRHGGRYKVMNINKSSKVASCKDQVPKQRCHKPKLVCQGNTPPGSHTRQS